MENILAQFTSESLVSELLRRFETLVVIGVGPTLGSEQNNLAVLHGEPKAAIAELAVLQAEAARKILEHRHSSPSTGAIVAPSCGHNHL